MITSVTPYFEDEKQLKRFLSSPWLDCIDEVIIIDDGSRKELAKDIIREHLRKQVIPVKQKFRLLRVSENLGFNAHGCRNLGAQQATNDWLLMVDIDIDFRGLDENIKTYLDCMQEKQFVGFKFGLMFEPAPSIHHDIEYNTFIIRKEEYLATRGYDEEFVNIHGGSRVFVDRLQTVYDRVFPSFAKAGPVRLGRDLQVFDGETTEYTEKVCYQPRKWEIVEDLLEMARQRNKQPETWKDKSFINFDWYEEKL